LQSPQQQRPRQQLIEQNFKYKDEIEFRGETIKRIVLQESFEISEEDSSASDVSVPVHQAVQAVQSEDSEEIKRPTLPKNLISSKSNRSRDYLKMQQMRSSIGALEREGPEAANNQKTTLS